MGLLLLGTLVAFFGTGLFSGSGIMGSEILPTAVRARALEFTYNGARAMSAPSPLVIGRVGQAKGLSWAFYPCAAGCLLAALVTPSYRKQGGNNWNNVERTELFKGCCTWSNAHAALL